jgi:two-component system chemotaxis sensor kinase CheA
MARSEAKPSVALRIASRAVDQGRVQADRSLIADFVVQAHEHLDAAEPLLLEFERSGQVPPDATNEIFRAVHSIKGAAGFLALEGIAELAHALEGVLVRLRDAELAWHASLADPLLRSVDHLRELLAGLPDDPGGLDRELVAQLEALALLRDPRDSLFADCEAQQRRGHSLAVVPLPAGERLRSAFLARLRRFAELVREDFPRPHQALVGSPLELDLLAEALGLEVSELAGWDVGAEAGAAAHEPPAAARAPDSIRVRVELLDRLMDLAGQLALQRNQLGRLAGESPSALLHELERIIGDLQESIMATRLQPIRVLFERLPRLIRDIGRRLGKAAELEISGGDVELDRSLVEALADPLTHLLRNALDHGIEAAEQRAARGKPEIGAISLRALPARGRVLIDLEDDGAGIDLARVRAAAVERGLLGAEQAAALPEREALALIFRVGISTARGVSELSGRGVGLDVVRTNIERLGGHIELESRPGRGTRFRIDLPLTLAIVPALVVSTGGERFALPQSGVIEVVRLGGGSRAAERVAGRELVRLRGRLLPLLRLRELLGISGQAAPPDAREAALVVRCGAGCFALVVEDLHDGGDIVVKPLPSFLAECVWYSGCTLLGDGRPALILDPAGIARSASLRPAELAPDPGGSARSAAVSRPLVLFEAAAGARFALPLDALSRLEALRPEQIERVGEREFFERRGRAVPLLHLHELLPVGAPTAPGEELFALIPRAQREVGIAAARIIDTVVSEVRPAPEGLRVPGIAGSALVEQRLTLCLDPAELVAAADAELGAR